MSVLNRGEGELFTEADPRVLRERFKNKGLDGHDKRMNAKTAIERFVHNGDYIASGGFGTNRISAILLHEVIRQKKKNLGLSGHTTTHDFQLLCAGECLNRCDAAYIVGLEARGLSPNARRQVQEGKIKICEWTNGALSWRMQAAAMGLSYIPCRSLLGTDTFKKSAAIEVECPFTGTKYAALPALSPDVALIHVHQADMQGNAVIEGLIVADDLMAQASKTVILSAEEIVSTGQLVSA